jgi:uncharacterized membrane protein YkvA (DUF1232 family)
MIVLAYVLSPIDLIPDFIPVVGYLDDVVLVPVGLVLFRRMIPAAVFEEHRLSAEVRLEERGKAAAAAAVTIVLVWMGLAVVALGAILC